jgi:hypothetical protein
MNTYKKIIDRLTEFESITFNELNGICELLGENTFEVFTYLKENGYLKESNQDTFTVNLSRSKKIEKPSSTEDVRRSFEEFRRRLESNEEEQASDTEVKDCSKEGTTNDKEDLGLNEKSLGIYNIINTTLTKYEMKYDYSKAESRFYLANIGEDLPIPLFIIIDEQRESVEFFSFLPFRFSEAKIADGAFSACIVNDKLLYGSFDFDVTEGSIMYKYVLQYELLNEELFGFLLRLVLQTIDCYNDKFYSVSEGKMTVTDLYNMLNKKDD